MSLAGFVALQKTEPMVLQRLAQLQARLDTGDESVWADFLQVIQALTALARDQGRTLREEARFTEHKGRPLFVVYRGVASP